MTDISTEPRVVVGFDGSEHSKKALRWGARMAEVFHARLDVIAAWHYPVGYGWASAPLNWTPGQDLEKLLNEAVDGLFKGDRPAGTTVSVHEGNAAHVLLDQSDGALMVVVGSRGHGGFSGLLLGSVSAAVAEHATCPVFVVHGDAVPTAA